MSLDYKNDIQFLGGNLEILVDTQHQNGITYKTQLLDALDTIAEMESEIASRKLAMNNLRKRCIEKGINLNA